MQIHKEPFSIAEVVTNVQAMLLVKAREKQLKLEVIIDSEVPVIVDGDSGRLVQILMNLAGNAIKFTEQGKVSIEVSKEKQVGKTVFIQIEVRDTGIGIPADRLNTMFEAYEQEYQQANKRTEGTGLGLAIVQQLVHLIKGTLSAESTLGQGSVFRVKLPYTVGALEDESPQETTAKDAKPMLNGISVLIAEDFKLNQLYIQRGVRKSWSKLHRG